MHERHPAIYIMANKRNGTLYTGVTSEQYQDMISAIAREKQIKSGSRKKKLALIESMNPGWLDLYETLL